MKHWGPGPQPNPKSPESNETSLTSCTVQQSQHRPPGQQCLLSVHMAQGLRHHSRTTWHHHQLPQILRPRPSNTDQTPHSWAPPSSLRLGTPSQGWLTQEWRTHQSQVWSFTCSWKSSLQWTAVLTQKLWDMLWDMWECLNKQAFTTMWPIGNKLCSQLSTKASDTFAKMGHNNYPVMHFIFYVTQFPQYSST